MHAHGHDHSSASSSAESGNFLSGLFDVYVPRQVCMNHEADVVWMHIISDALIAAAYFSIPLALLAFIRQRKDIEFRWMFAMFAAFIIFCGITHLFGLLAIWHPLYRLDGVVKLATGTISVATAIALWPLIPKAIALPSPTQLREANVALEQSNAALERRVRDRTGELAQRNTALEREIAVRRSIEHSMRAIQREREELLTSEQNARADAEHASRMKDDFVAMLSHELRTPISAILGWVHQLRRGDTSRMEHALEVIERNARIQSKLIADLLDTSLIVAGKLRLDMQEFDLRSAIDAAVDAVRPAADAKGVRVERVTDPLAQPVKGDPIRIQQVVGNLLVNAIKYTPRNGRVEVSLDRIDSRVRITVADTGHGIPPEFLPYVFDRYRQSVHGIARPEGGMGLGLAIVRNLVELHGGSVAVASDGVDRGTTVTVTLPVPDERTDAAPDADSVLLEAGEPTTKSDATLAPLAGIRVLFVDDDADTRDVMLHLFTDLGASAKTAGSADDALKALLEELPHILVSDIGMPGRSGYDLIADIRARHHERILPAVAMTAFARPQDRARSLDAGYQAHIAKPVDVDELVEAIRALVGRSATD